MKDRIRRALKWKPAAPWMAAVLFVLAVALGLLLLNDPPFPDPTVNGLFPLIKDIISLKRKVSRFCR